jgi:hypothetical protein
MAVSIDKVYQKVLALANKEQRGYITPQEFNLFADHAQMDIFEQYFYDLEQASRVNPSSLDYADKVTNLDEKISLFERYDVPMSAIGSTGDVHFGTGNVYKLGIVRVKYSAQNTFKEVEEVQPKELNTYLASPLTRSSSLAGPYYVKHYANNIYGDRDLRITVYPYPIAQAGDQILVSYTEKPISPNWTYSIVNGNALYNPSAADHQVFELHSSEENKLVIGILKLAGISIKDPQLVQIASQEEMKKIQLEKQ